MSFRTYDEEKRSELIDALLQEIGHLTLLMLKARTEEQLAEMASPTSLRIRKGYVQLINSHLPRIEDLRRQIDVVHEMLEKFDAELIAVNAVIQKQAPDNEQRKYDEAHPGSREAWEKLRSSHSESNDLLSSILNRNK